MFDVDDIAAQADVIIGGFAALIRDESVKVVNLNTGIGAAVFTPDGTLVDLLGSEFGGNGFYRGE